MNKRIAILKSPNPKLKMLDLGKSNSRDFEFPNSKFENFIRNCMFSLPEWGISGRHLN
jgi:hypothetical protein